MLMDSYYCVSSSIWKTLMFKKFRMCYLLLTPNVGYMFVCIFFFNFSMFIYGWKNISEPRQLSHCPLDICRAVRIEETYFGKEKISLSSYLSYWCFVGPIDDTDGNSHASNVQVLYKILILIIYNIKDKLIFLTATISLKSKHKR